MKRTLTVLFAAVLVAAMFVPAFAATPAYPVEYSEMMSYAGAMHYVSVNAASYWHDYNYGGDFSKMTTSDGKTIVTKLSDDPIEAAGQELAATALAGDACFATPIGINNPADQARQFNVQAQKDQADSVYHSSFPFGINGGAETTVSSFTIAVAPQSCKVSGAPNGFDIYLGLAPWSNKAEIGNPTYKLAYHAEGLNDLGMWKESDDGTYQFFEANLSETFQAGYGVILFRWDDVKNGALGRTADGSKERSYILLTEFCMFEDKLENASKVVVTTEEVTTAAPITDAPTQPAATDPAAPETDKQTEPPVTDNGDTPIITAAPKTEPVKDEKKGCGSAVASMALIAVVSLGALAIRKKH